MTPQAWFLKELRFMDPGLSVRLVPWGEGLGGAEQVYVWPIKGRPFQADPSAMPQPARFVIFERNKRKDIDERVFDVVYPDGSFMPLDRRSLEGLSLRRTWSDMGGKRLAALNKETKEREAIARKKETISSLEADGGFHSAMERLYREETGLSTHALGAPGAPTPALRGKTSGVSYEETAGPPVRPEPKQDISVAIEQ